MGKVIGLLVTVGGIWAGVEIATYGVDGAFNGAFAQDGASSVTERVSTPQRAGRAVEGAHAASEERRARMLGE